MDKPSPRHWMADGARPSDLLRTPADTEDFAAHLAVVNEERRERNERIERLRLRSREAA